MNRTSGTIPKSVVWWIDGGPGKERFRRGIWNELRHRPLGTLFDHIRWHGSDYLHYRYWEPWSNQWTQVVGRGPNVNLGPW